MEILSITRESRGYLVKQPRKHFDSEWDSFFFQILQKVNVLCIDRLKINIIDYLEEFFTKRLLRKNYLTKS